MKRRTLLIVIIIPVFVIVTVMATLFIHYRSLIFSPREGVEFSGVITAATVHCNDNSQPSTLTIDDKIVTVKPAHTSSSEPFGYTDLNLCGVFGSSDSYGTVHKRDGDTNVGGWLIGRSVDVQAKQLDTSHYTLEGSANYHVTGA